MSVRSCADPEWPHCSCICKIQKETYERAACKSTCRVQGSSSELNLPSAPEQFIQYMEEDNRPQVTEDVNFENGMGVSIGRLRERILFTIGSSLDFPTTL